MIQTILKTISVRIRHIVPKQPKRHVSALFVNDVIIEKNVNESFVLKLKSFAHTLYAPYVLEIALCHNLSLTYFSYDYGSIQVYCASSVKLIPVPQAISQLFAILHSRILEVIYKLSERALSVHIAARLRLASINTDKVLSLGL